MESPPNSTSSWLDTGDDGELRPLEACLLKFMWVCSENLDSVDFIKTAILIRSLSVGKRMTRTLVCDMLAEFTRFFRCAQTESKFNSKTCDTWCSKTKEALESWINYDVDHNTGNNNNKKLKGDTTALLDTEKPENWQFSYQNPFDCPINLYAVVKSLTIRDKEQTASIKTTEAVDENQNLLLTVKDVSKTLEKYTKRYSTYVHSLDKATLPFPTGTSACGELLDSTGSSSELEDTQSVPATEEKSELVLSECLIQQSKWLESVLRGKTPEKGDSYGCNISNGEGNEVQEEEEAVLAEFTSVAQNFLPIWSSGNTELNGLGSNLEDEEYQKQMCVLETNTSPQKSPVYTEASTILEEVSMDISDSFEEWFADSRNIILLELLQSKGLESLPDGFLDPQDASTPLEELQDEKDQEVESLWPKLSTINPHTRRRLWDDTDIGVSNLSVVDTAYSRLNPQQEEKDFHDRGDGSTKEGLAEGDFQHMYLSNKPIPSIDELSFYYPEKMVVPTTRATKMRAPAQPEMFRTKSMPSGTSSQAYLPATHTMPHHHPHPHPQAAFQNSHPHMQHHDQAVNPNVTWAQAALNGVLPNHNPNCTSVTQSHNYGQGHFAPYNLWAQPPPNTVQHVHGQIQPPARNNSLRYHTPIGASMTPPNEHYADWQRKNQQDKTHRENPMNSYSRFPGSIGAAKSQAQVNAEFAMNQDVIRQQVLQPPPGRNNIVRPASNPSVPTHHTMKQLQQLKQQYQPHYSANLPSSKAPTEFDIFFQQELQKQYWSAAEQLASNGQPQARPGGGTGTSFMAHPPQHVNHQAFMQRQKQEHNKYVQQYMQQQPPMQQQLPRQDHAMPDVLPPWRRTRPQETMPSLNPDQGFAPSTFEAWAAGGIAAPLPEKRPGPEYGMATSSVHNTSDYRGPQLHNNNTTTHSNVAARNVQYNSVSQMPTSKAYFTPQWPSVSETHDMNRKKDFSVNEWQHFHHQILQSNNSLKHAQPEFYPFPIQQDQEFPPMQTGPVLPATDFRPSKDSTGYYPAAYEGGNYPSVFQAFSPHKQQHVRQGVPSMAEVAWASLGHYKPQAQHLPPSGDQRYQSVRPPMM